MNILPLCIEIIESNGLHLLITLYISFCAPIFMIKIRDKINIILIFQRKISIVNHHLYHFPGIAFILFQVGR